MTVTALMGSPRKTGNTAALLDASLAGIKTANPDIDVNRIDLNELDVKHCRGCSACQRGLEGHCILKDDMTGLYEMILRSEVLVIATPVFTFSVPAPVKAVMDRFFAVSTRLRGRKIVLLSTYGDTLEDRSGFLNIDNMMKGLCGYTGMDYARKLAVSSAMTPVKDNTDALRTAGDLGSALVRPESNKQ